MGPLLVAILVGTLTPGASPVPAVDDAALDPGPLGPARQVGVGERLPRVLDLLATDAGVVSPLQGGPFPLTRAVELVGRLEGPVSGPFAPWAIARAPLHLSDAEARALHFNLRSFAVLVVDDVAVQVSPFFGPEVYARGSAVDEGPAWELGFRERQPLLGVDTQASWRLTDDVMAWGRVTFDLRQDQNLYTRPQPRSVETNVMSGEAVDVAFPHRALVGLSGEAWGLHIGRDRLTLGNGRMGNFLLGDSADVHDFARAQLFLPQFTWTSLVLRLDPTLLPDEQLLPGMDRLRSQQKHLVIHRAEFVILEKLHISGTEGWMVGGVPLDLRHLNPLLIFHNQFPWNDVEDYRSASVMLTLEATLVPVRGLKLWGQYALNQVQSPVERLWYPEAAAAIPDATALLAGVEVTAPIRLYAPTVSSWVKPAGVLHVFGGAEFVETSPFFGLRENPLTTWASRRRLPSNLPGGAGLVEQPLGWRFGPDSRVLRLWTGALDVGLGQLELGVEHRLKGEQTLRSPYAEGADAVALSTPTGTAEISRVVTVQVELLPLRFERFSATVRLDWRRFFVENLRHVAGETLVDDQVVLGVRVDL